MGQLKNLPYEVKVQLLEEFYYERGSQLRADREMYTIYQTLLFRCIGIDVSKPNKYFNAIVKSTSSTPGEWVKTLYLTPIPPVEDLRTIDPANDHSINSSDACQR